MTNQAAIVSDVETDVRWRDWHARGIASDRRTATRMRAVLFLVAAALAAWFFVQLV